MRPIGIDSVRDKLQLSMQDNFELFSILVEFNACLSAASSSGNNTTKTINIKITVIGMQLGLHQLCAPHLKNKFTFF